MKISSTTFTFDFKLIDSFALTKNVKILYINLCLPHIAAVCPCEYTQCIIVHWQRRKADSLTDMKNSGILSPLASVPTISLFPVHDQGRKFSAILPLTQEGVSHTRTRRPLNLPGDSSVLLCHDPKKERKIYVRGKKKEEGIYMSLCFVSHP